MIKHGKVHVKLKLKLKCECITCVTELRKRKDSRKLEKVVLKHKK